MASRWFNVATVLLWLASMSWLLIAKVLPPLLVGEPPTYQQIISQPDERVTWSIRWDDEPVGSATSWTDRGIGDVIQMHSDVRLERIPLAKLTPVWMAPLVGGSEGLEGFLNLRTESRVDVDPLGNLIGIESTLRMDPMTEPIRMNGVVDDGMLRMQVSVGTQTFTNETSLPPTGLVSDMLSPEPRLTELRVGQSWTKPVYSPFRPRNSPMEVLHVQVEREEWISWNDRAVNCLLVVYRDDPGAQLSTSSKDRGKMWVRRDGTVLRQEMSVLNSRMIFDRVSSTPINNADSETPEIKPLEVNP